MNTNTILVPALAALCAAAATAQVQIPVNVRATYLRTSNDPQATPAPGIPISALGLAAGQWCEIHTVGAYSQSGADNYRSLLAVFSNGVVLLPDGQVNRVPGALSAGPAFRSNNTYYSNLPTDIPQDFVVSYNGVTNGVVVRVPAGATHVFFTIDDGYVSNRTDPNNDFAVVFTPASPATLQGTGEHVELRTAVGGTPAAAPDVKPAAPFSVVNAEVRQKFGRSTNQTYMLFGDLVSTSLPVPAGPFPGTWLGSNAVLLQIGAMPSYTSSAPAQWSLFVPPGVAGYTLVLQAGLLNPDARNGIFESSIGHRVQFQ
jgi:hypothetical protein